MAAIDFIREIFSRYQSGVDANQRVVSRAQFDVLRRLIEEEAEKGTVRKGQGNSLVWAPAGRDKYVLTEGDVLKGTRNKLTRLSNLVASGAGSLFPPPPAVPEPEQGRGDAWEDPG